MDYVRTLTSLRERFDGEMSKKEVFKRERSEKYPRKVPKKDVQEKSSQENNSVAKFNGKEVQTKYPSETQS
jgi:hypothetical protein